MFEWPLPVQDYGLEVPQYTKPATDRFVVMTPANQPTANRCQPLKGCQPLAAIEQPVNGCQPLAAIECRPRNWYQSQTWCQPLFSAARNWYQPLFLVTLQIIASVIACIQSRLQSCLLCPRRGDVLCPRRGLAAVEARRDLSVVCPRVGLSWCQPQTWCQPLFSAARNWCQSLFSVTLQIIACVIACIQSRLQSCLLCPRLRLTIACIQSRLLCPRLRRSIAGIGPVLCPRIDHVLCTRIDRVLCPRIDRVIACIPSSVLCPRVALGAVLCPRVGLGVLCPRVVIWMVGVWVAPLGAGWAEEAPGAKALYQQAATALVQKEIAGATQLLARLVEDYPSDDLAPLAAMRLAECQLAQGKTDACIETLEGWLEKLDSSSRVQSLEPTAPLRAHSVLARAYLAKDRYDKVNQIATQQIAKYSSADESHQKLLTTIRSLQSQATTRQQQSDSTLLRSAAQAVQEKRFPHALALLAKVDPAQLSAAWRWRYHVLKSQSLSGSAQPREALIELDRIELDLLKESEKLPVRLAMFDAAVATSNFTRAQKEIDLLKVAVSMDPDLAATIRLRAVELAMLKKDRSTADQLARSARQEFPKFASLHEFDLLLARNALAQVEFATARELLQSIIDNPPPSDPTAVPRAQWLLGESYLLSLDANRAIAAYSQVIEGSKGARAGSSQAGVWLESSLMQRGKCFEQTGDIASARADYRALVDRFPQSSLKAAAQSRLDEIEPLLKTAATAGTTPPQ